MGNGLLSLWTRHAGKFEVKELDKWSLSGLVNAHVNLPVILPPILSALLPRFCIPWL